MDQNQKLATLLRSERLSESTTGSGMRFDGKVALVTGASHGIGRAAALALDAIALDAFGGLNS